MPSTEPALPYGPRLGRMLQPLHAWFVPLNGVVAPALRAGLGAFISNPLTGYLMVLRTRGRRTGRVREVPLGYVVLDGAVYCCAGFGASTAWYRNVLADGRVEVVLPGRTIVGRAAVVDQPEERIRAYRALMASLGLVSRMAMGDLRRLDDETLLKAHRAIPLVRITPIGIQPGELDPGGRFWVAAAAAWMVLLGLLGRAASRLRRHPARTRRPVAG